MATQDTEEAKKKRQESGSGTQDQDKGDSIWQERVDYYKQRVKDVRAALTKAYSEGSQKSKTDPTAKASQKSLDKLQKELEDLTERLADAEASARKFATFSSQKRADSYRPPAPAPAPASAPAPTSKPASTPPTSKPARTTPAPVSAGDMPLGFTEDEYNRAFIAKFSALRHGRPIPVMPNAQLEKAANYEAQYLYNAANYDQLQRKLFNNWRSSPEAVRWREAGWPTYSGNNLLTHQPDELQSILDQSHINKQAELFTQFLLGQQPPLQPRNFVETNLGNYPGFLYKFQ